MGALPSLVSAWVATVNQSLSPLDSANGSVPKHRKLLGCPFRTPDGGEGTAREESLALVARNGLVLTSTGFRCSEVCDGVPPLCCSPCMLLSAPVACRVVASWERRPRDSSGTPNFALVHSDARSKK